MEMTEISLEGSDHEPIHLLAVVPQHHGGASSELCLHDIMHLLLGLGLGILGWTEGCPGAVESDWGLKIRVESRLPCALGPESHWQGCKAAKAFSLTRSPVGIQLLHCPKGDPSS